MGDKTENALEGAGIIAGIIDELSGVPVASTFKEVAMMGNDALSKMCKYPPNPRMVDNGHCENEDQKKSSGQTCRYFRWRTAKKIGGGGLSAVGNVLGTVTQVNVGGVARHGVSEAKTLAHLYALHQMAKKVRQSQYLCSLIKVVVTMKVTKASVQGGKLASSCIPNPIAQAMVGAAVHLGGALKKHQMSSVVMHAAHEIHWRAFQESTIAGALGGGSGPATRLIAELFKFSAPRSGGMTRAERYIPEPAGWMVIQDKLNLV